jgi:hypothetical protein
LIRIVDDRYQVEYRYGADGQRASKFSREAAFATETLYFSKLYQVNYQNNKAAWVEHAEQTGAGVDKILNTNVYGI